MRIIWHTAEDQIVASHIGTPLLTNRTYRELRGPVDTLLVAGGDDPREMRYSPDFIGWLRERSTNVRRLGSVCTGALVLADADLLDGRRVTTHWNWCSDLFENILW
ncbi:MAG: DJ-1/PfpI family protein [Chthoniobacterales bacterium]